MRIEIASDRLLIHTENVQDELVMKALFGEPQKSANKLRVDTIHGTNPKVISGLVVRLNPGK